MSGLKKFLNPLCFACTLGLLPYLSSKLNEVQLNGKTLQVLKNSLQPLYIFNRAIQTGLRRGLDYIALRNLKLAELKLLLKVSKVLKIVPKLIRSKNPKTNSFQKSPKIFGKNPCSPIRFSEKFYPAHLNQHARLIEITNKVQTWLFALYSTNAH